MKKLILYYVIIGMLLLSACSNTSSAGQDSDVTPEETQASELTETDAVTEAVTQEALSISVTPPDGWTPVEGSVLPVQYMKNTASFMAKIEGFAGKTLDDTVSTAKSAIESAFDDVTYMGEVETISVDGLDARKFIFTCDMGFSMKYEYVYTFVGSDVWAITFADMEETFDNLAVDFEQILFDIHFE